MTSTYRACGKLILLGEHFVVHGVPAVAVPLRAVTTEVRAERAGDRLVLDSELSGEPRRLAEDVLAAAVERLGLGQGWRVGVRSNIPVGYGLGSSAAWAVALVGALTGGTLSREELGGHAHALERLVHGQPSGIDDTVISRERPVRFVRGEPPQLLTVGGRLTLVLGSCGYAGSTRDAVAGVAAFGQREPERFAALLDEARAVVEGGLAALRAGDHGLLGPLLTRCHGLLRQVGVSTAELDDLVDTALDAGALGAKLTGAGRGGFVLALAQPEAASAVVAALERRGADHVMTTEIGV